MLGGGTGGNALPLMYTELAEWFHLITRPADYAVEAGLFVAALERVLPPQVKGRPRTMLELGSGGGNNASYLKRHFAMTLVDLSPAMIEVSRRLNPELRHLQGDMRTVRLGELFDAVFIHDAVMYMTSEDDLRAALATGAAHLRLGGALLVVPDCTEETFSERTHAGGHDGTQVTPPQPGRALRYLEWVHDPDRRDTEYTVDFAYLLQEAGGAVTVRQDRHVFGLFPRSTWLGLMEGCGLVARAVSFDHPEVEPGTEMFIGIRER